MEGKWREGKEQERKGKGSKLNRREWTGKNGRGKRKWKGMDGKQRAKGKRHKMEWKRRNGRDRKTEGDPAPHPTHGGY